MNTGNRVKRSENLKKKLKGVTVDFQQLKFVQNKNSRL